MSKINKKYVIGVIDRVPSEWEDGNRYDNIIESKDVRMDMTCGRNPYINLPDYICFKDEVFTLGEILILDSTYGREISGHQRKPSKWNVGCKEFIDINKATQYAIEITKKASELLK